MKISVSHNDIIIIEKILTQDECNSLDGIGVVWIVNAYKKYIGLDISSYRLSELKDSPYHFTVFIRTEDLVKLRDNKLGEILESI
jgi:hypothetical protein